MSISLIIGSYAVFNVLNIAGISIIVVLKWILLLLSLSNYQRKYEKDWGLKCQTSKTENCCQIIKFIWINVAWTNVTVTVCMIFNLWVKWKCQIPDLRNTVRIRLVNFGRAVLDVFPLFLVTRGKQSQCIVSVFVSVQWYMQKCLFVFSCKGWTNIDI